MGVVRGWCRHCSKDIKKEFCWTPTGGNSAECLLIQLWTQSDESFFLIYKNHLLFAVTFVLVARLSCCIYIFYSITQLLTYNCIGASRAQDHNVCILCFCYLTFRKLNGATQWYHWHQLFVHCNRNKILDNVAWSWATGTSIKLQTCKQCEGCIEYFTRLSKHLDGWCQQFRWHCH